MRKKAGVLTLSCGLAILNGAVSAQTVDATNTLPDAKPGECYAKVMIPAQYETRTEEVLVGEEAEKIEPVEAVYQEMEEQVLVEPEDVELIPVPAVYKTVMDRVEISPLQTLWVNDLGDQGIPVSPLLLSAAKSSIADLDAAIPGMCFQEYYRPVQYETESVEVLVRESSEEINIIPAEYEWVEKQVLVKEAARKVVEIPASYETVTEDVLIEPAKTVWKKGNGLVERVDNTTGEIMCLVEVPAQYKTISKRVVQSPARVEEIEIPAVYEMVKVRKQIAPAREERLPVPEAYQTVTKQVKVADASFSWHGAHESEKPAGIKTGNQICLKEIPAKYHEHEKQVLERAALVETKQIEPVFTTIAWSKLVSDASENRTTIPAEYKTVTKTEKVSDERLEWRPVLCETNMTKDIVSRVQGALKQAGYDVGAVDGVIGGATLRAVDSYQRDEDLPRGGLTIRTLEALGVAL